MTSVYKYIFFFFYIQRLALNSTDKPRCRGCTHGYFCVGNGTEERCGLASPTEFSFGSAATCSPCPEGWVSGSSGVVYLSLGMSGRVLEWVLYPVSTKTFDFSKAYLILKAPTIFSKTR